MTSVKNKPFMLSVSVITLNVVVPCNELGRTLGCLQVGCKLLTMSITLVYGSG
jgi:hypothetical protein